MKFKIFLKKIKRLIFKKPTVVTLVVTNNCILRCKQCELWKSKPEKQISFEDAKKIIDKLYSWLGDFYLFFTGGEPFINKDLIKIIKYAQSKGISTHVNSNAILINKKLAQEIDNSKLEAISISIDGATPKTHNFLRGVGGSFERSWKAISFLKKNNKNKLKVFINMVLMSKNINEIEDLIKLAIKNKISGINFQCLLPILATKQNLKDLKKKELWPKFEEVEKNIFKIRKTKIVLNSGDNLQKIIDYYKNPESFEKIKCLAGIDNLIVDNKGGIKLCFDFPNLGNVLKDDPKKIWFGKEAKKQRILIGKCKKPCKIIACNNIN